MGCAPSAANEIAQNPADLKGGKQRRRVSLMKVQELLGPKSASGKNETYERALEAAYAKFVSVDTDNSGNVDCKEFCRAFALEFNIFTQRLWRLFDLDNSGDISFREFLYGLSRFSSKGVHDKVTFAFHLFDVDGSGTISVDEFVAAFKQGYRAQAWGEQSGAVIGDAARTRFTTLVEEVGGKNREVNMHAFRVLVAKHPAAFAYPFTMWNVMAEYSKAAGIVVRELERQGTVDSFLRDVAGRHVRHDEDPMYAHATTNANSKGRGRSNEPRRVAPYSGMDGGGGGGGRSNMLQRASNSFRRASISLQKAFSPKDGARAGRGGGGGGGGGGPNMLQRAGNSFRRASISMQKAFSPNRGNNYPPAQDGSRYDEYGSHRDRERNGYGHMQQGYYSSPARPYNDGGGYNCSEYNDDGDTQLGNPYSRAASRGDDRFSNNRIGGYYGNGANPEYSGYNGNHANGGGYHEGYANPEYSNYGAMDRQHGDDVRSNPEYESRMAAKDSLFVTTSGRLLDASSISQARTVMQKGPLRKTSSRRGSIMEAMKNIANGFSMEAFARGSPEKQAPTGGGGGGGGRSNMLQRAGNSFRRASISMQKAFRPSRGSGGKQAPQQKGPRRRTRGS